MRKTDRDYDGLFIFNDHISTWFFDSITLPHGIKVNPLHLIKAGVLMIFDRIIGKTNRAYIIYKVPK